MILLADEDIRKTDAKTRLAARERVLLLLTNPIKALMSPLTALRALVEAFIALLAILFLVVSVVYLVGTLWRSFSTGDLMILVELQLSVFCLVAFIFLWGGVFGFGKTGRWRKKLRQ